LLIPKKYWYYQNRGGNQVRGLYTHATGFGSMLNRLVLNASGNWMTTYAGSIALIVT